MEFYEIDLSQPHQIAAMTAYILQNYGCPDVVFNNATITKIGAVDEIDAAFWDQSCAVNLRAPLCWPKRFCQYWQHQLELLQGYERNKARLDEHTRIILGWIADLEDRPFRIKFLVYCFLK